jgi:hypothetical protein
VGLPWYHGSVGNDCGLVEFLFASFVGTSEFFVLMSMEKLHGITSADVLGIASFNKPCQFEP